MVDRSHKPSALARTPTLPPQPTATISDDNTRVVAALPTGERAEVLLFGATVISWKNAAGNEKLWLSDAAKMDGSKPTRGGIPLVFPVFGTAPDHAATAKLPQHGFARNNKWEYLGKSSGETEEASSVKLDFGLSWSSLPEATRELWPYKFGLVYSVTLGSTSLATSLVVTNEGNVPFDCQMLMHTYFRVRDIANVAVAGLGGSNFLDKVNGKQIKTQDEAPITFSGEMDSLYTPDKPANSSPPIVISEKDRGEIFTITRENLDDVVVWNPWTEKAADMADFEPKMGWKQMVCVEAGSVRQWLKLEPGDTFEGQQVMAYA